MKSGCLPLFLLILFMSIPASVIKLIFGCSLEAGMIISFGIASVIFLILDPDAFISSFKLKSKKELIEERKNENAERKKRIVANSKKCPLCESKSITTTWVDTWKIGKAGRSNLYICNECGKNWSLNYKGNIKWYY